MKTINWMSLIAVAALAVACDPYTDAKKGTPNIAAVTAANTADGATAVVGAPAGAAWTVTGNSCGTLQVSATSPILNPGQFDVTAFFITFDRQIDGGLVQTSLTDCTPTGGWLTVTPAAPAGFTWYSCYTPSSPQSREGGSVVVYQAPAAVPASAGPPAVEAVLASSGWGDAVYIDNAPIHITGTVAGRVIDVNVDACPP